MKKINILLISFFVAVQLYAQNERVYISNEGNFGSGNGSLSYYDRSMDQIQNNVFQTANGAPLGDVAQSVEEHNGRLFIVVNNSGKVEMADPTNFQTMGTISGLSSPRYFKAVSNSKAYVSDWVSNTVAVIDLNTYTVSGTVAVGNSPERMAFVNGYLYVTNSGAYAMDSTVSVIDTASDQVVTTIAVGDAPNSIQVDANGKLWVLSGGDPAWTGGTPTAGRLSRIDPSTNTVEFSLSFPGTSENPATLLIDRSATQLYYLSNAYSGNVMRFHINDTSLDTTALIAGSYYTIGYDHVADEIYASDPIDYVQNGRVDRYQAADGASVASFNTGIIPGGFYFMGNAPVAVDEWNEASPDYQFFPNPASDQVIVDFSETLKGATIRMIDITGKVVYEVPAAAQSTRINLSRMQKGLYIIQLQSPEGLVSKRLLVQ